MTAQHLAAQEGGYEPQRAYNGQLMVFGLEGWNTPFGYMTLGMESFDLPIIDAGCTDMEWMGQVRKTVGKIDFDDLEIVVRDFVDKPTSALVWQWIQQVFNNAQTGVFGDFVGFLNNPLQQLAESVGFARVPPEGGRGLAKDYKKYAIAVMTGPDGSHHRGYILRGVWPKRFVPGRIDYESEEILKGALTLSVDTAEYLGGITAVEDALSNPEGFITGLI